jgi:hypothetical protein
MTTDRIEKPVWIVAVVRMKIKVHTESWACRGALRRFVEERVSNELYRFGHAPEDASYEVSQLLCDSEEGSRPTH